MSAPALDLPASLATVSVKALNAGHATVPSSLFYRPNLPGHENLSAICFAFYIENHAKDQRVVFDLGIRADPENFPPAIQQLLSHGAQMVSKKDVATQLKENGIDLKSVSAIIWSHSHADHTGDPSTFPPGTDLVVGPGTQAAFFPTYPENPQSPLLASDFAGRRLREISADEFSLSIGGFRAYDYFNDGSFYLLDAPGHTFGHMAGLARTTTDTFVFLGGDTCHHPGIFRPTAHIHRYFPCPGAILESAASRMTHSYFFDEGESTNLSKRTRPFLTIPPADVPSVHVNTVDAQESITKMADHFDAHPNVLVVIAHDSSVTDIIPFFPYPLNDWKKLGLKERMVWAFLEEGNPAFIFNVDSSA